MQQSLTWLGIDASRPLVPVVVPNDANRQVLSGGRNVLADLVDVEEDVLLEHDVDWDVFPEIVEALRLRGFEEISFCVASSPSQDRLGVGLAGKQKLREQAARVALAVALASDLEDFGQLAARHADFTNFCGATGMNTGALPGGRAHSSPEPSAKRRRVGWGRSPQLEEDRHEEEARWTATREDVQEEVLQGGTLAPEGAPAEESETLPRNEPMWISLPDDDSCPDQLRGLPLGGLALSFDGRGGGLYNKADKILAMFVSPHEIEAYDDASWESFPSIGDELRKHSSREECLHVLACAGRDLWAVGVAMRSKNRIAAAKLALAVSLGLQNPDVVEDLEIPEFEDLVDQARLASQNQSNLEDLAD